MAREVYDRRSGRDNLRDIYLRHGINLTRYSTNQARELIKILDTSNKQVRGIIRRAKSIETKNQYRSVAAEIRSITKELNQQLSGQLELDFKALAEQEAMFVKNAAHNVGVTANFNLPAPEKIWAAASFGSYTNEGRETFKTYLNGLTDNFYKTWDTNVRAGYITGLTAQQINRNVLGNLNDLDPGQMQTLRRSLEMNTRTMVAHLAETARMETYKKNSSIFSGFRYIATLDSRTCLVCGELDGQIFEGSEPPAEPALPQHYNCRCLWLPEIKGMEGFDDDDMRASADGPVSANLTYEEWLKTQPPEVQRDILGPTRFEMYKNGAPVDAFVADGRTLTIKDLIEIQVMESQRYGLSSLETSLDIRKGEVIDYDTAYRGANPNRGNSEYDRNCQRCVPTYELRRRGFDVIAAPKPGINNQVEFGYECFEGARERVVGHLNGSNFGEGALRNQLGRLPEGSRCGIIIAWKSGGGHTIVSEKINGVTRFFDPQTSQETPNFFNRVKMGHISFYRMDDLNLSSDIDWTKVVRVK